MKIIDQGIIYSGTPNTKHAILSFPSVVQLTNSTLLAGFQASSLKNNTDSHILFSRSFDGGKTWEEPFAPFGNETLWKERVIHLAYVSEVSPGRLIANLLWCDHLGDPSLEFFNPGTEGVLPISIYLSESADDGLTWSIPGKIDAGELGSTPIPIMGPISRINDHELICPFETSKNYDDTGPWIHKAAYFISRDEGKTWPEYKIVAHDPQNKIFYWDHRIANFGSGLLIDMLWAYDNVQKKQLNAHMSKTSDGGKTWSAPVDTGLVGQPWPIAIDEKTFLVACVDRYQSKTIRVVKTDDFGRSWDAARSVVIYNHQQKQQERSEKLDDYLVEMGSWAYGLVNGIKLSNGNVLVTYYAGNGLTTNICWSLLEI